MSNLSLILLGSIFAIASANAGIPNPCPCPQPPGSPQCPDDAARDSAPKAMNPVFCPGKKMEVSLGEVDESRRKLTGIPKSTWDKMRDFEKAIAVEKAKEAKSKGAATEK